MREVRKGHKDLTKKRRKLKKKILRAAKKKKFRIKRGKEIQKARKRG